MKKILVVNGANLNMLGIREPNLYGKEDYNALKKYISCSAKELGLKVKIFQSNEEGKIVTAIQKAIGKFDGIVINAGGYTHTSIAILDALKCTGLPTAEVHLTDIHSREKYRDFSFISEYAFFSVCGKGFSGYKEALEKLKERLNEF